MRTISLKLANASYDILVGVGAMDRLEESLAIAGLTEPCIVVSQARIVKALGRHLRRQIPVICIPDGERAKSLSTVNKLLGAMMKQRLTRQSTVIAVGGGVVGDVAGFAASIYMRGINVVQVPTSLLAQVDSSIGGKTGINYGIGKNLVGTFHQPALVLCDPSLLKTLSDREYRSGLYEAIKYGIARVPSLFVHFERNMDTLQQRNPEALERLVAACAAAKAEVVMADEKEGGLRRILNLGHTVGHALESAAGYRRIRHGEAVGYGMVAAARISAALGKLGEADLARIENGVRQIGRLPRLDGVHWREVSAALQHDKKGRDGSIHFVLPRTVGQVEIVAHVPLELVRQVVQGLLHESKRTR